MFRKKKTVKEENNKEIPLGVQKDININLKGLKEAVKEVAQILDNIDSQMEDMYENDRGTVKQYRRLEAKKHRISRSIQQIKDDLYKHIIDFNKLDKYWTDLDNRVKK